LAADLNGDGHIDLAFPRREINTLLGQSFLVGLRPWWGNGDGTFRTGSDEVAITSNPYRLIPGDFTGDGRLDIVLASNSLEYGNVVGLLRNLGDGQFIDQSTIFTDQHSNPQLGDVDGDGTPDVVVVSAHGDIYWRRGRRGEPGTYDPPLIVNPDT